MSAAPCRHFLKNRPDSCRKFNAEYYKKVNWLCGCELIFGLYLMYGTIKFYGLLTSLVHITNAFHAPTAAETEEIESAVEVVYTEDSIFSMQLIFGLYLMYGTIKGKQEFLFASLMLHLAFIAYSAFFVVFAMITMFENSAYTSEYSLPNDEQIANEALKIPVFIYFALVIYGRHEELEIRSPTLMEPLSRRTNDSDSEEIA